MNTLASPRVAETLEDLFLRAEAEDAPILAKLSAEASQSSAPLDDSKLAERLRSAWIAVDRPSGRLLHAAALARRPRLIVEFGTSFGISTIHLAAALRDLGGGRVVSTEMEPAKVAAARANLSRAGLDDLVDLRGGDALQTLADLDGPIDMLFLDGWKGLYLPVLRLLEPRLAPFALVVADDTSLFPDIARPYLDHVRDPARGYASAHIHLGDGLEYSVRLGGPM